MADTKVPLAEDGQPMVRDRVAKLSTAYNALRELTDFERRLVLCWFCRSCSRYVGPDDHCKCDPNN